MSAFYWFVVAIACGGLALYACRRTTVLRSAARLRRRVGRRQTTGEAGICFWGYNDRGELIHVRVKREAANQRNVSVRDIPEFLRSGPVLKD